MSMTRTENRYEEFKKNEPQKYQGWDEGYAAKTKDTSKDIVDAIEHIQEIRKILDLVEPTWVVHHDRILSNVTAAVKILNGILREDTVFSMSVTDPPSLFGLGRADP